MMLNPLEEKKMLIESMKKLVSHVSNNPQRQQEIFQALSLQDLQKVLLNLRDENQYLRRLSALLLCELFFMCGQTRQRAVEVLSISPGEGRLCLGGIPEAISKYPSTLKRCIELMKSPVEEGEEDKMCWLINLERKTLKIEMMDYRKYSSFTFIDPNKNIFGFVIPSRDSQPSMVPVRDSEQKKSCTIQSPQYATGQLSSEFHKSYINARQTTNDSKRHSIQGNFINLASSVNSQTDRSPVAHSPRPNTAHLNPSAKREELRKSIDTNKMSSSLTMSLGGKTSYGIDKIITSARQQRELIEKKSGDYSFLGYRGSKQKEQRDELQAKGQPERGLGPQTDKISPARQTSKDPERFYRRVKEILRK